MKQHVQRGLLTCLILAAGLSALARPVRFTLDIWKESPAAYQLEMSSYRGAELVVKRKLTIEMAVEPKVGKVNVLFRPSARQVVEANSPDLRESNEIERMVDAFLGEFPIVMTFDRENRVELNLEKNLKNAEKFHKRYPATRPSDSLARQIPLDAFQQEVYIHSQGLIGLFVNKLLFGTEFEEGRMTYHYPQTEPIREAAFELVTNPYGCFLTGEAFVTDGQGKAVARNSYRFEFSPMLDVMNGMRMEVVVLDTQVRNVFVLTR